MLRIATTVRATTPLLLRRTSASSTTAALLRVIGSSRTISSASAGISTTSNDRRRSSPPVGGFDLHRLRREIDDLPRGAGAPRTFSAGGSTPASPSPKGPASAEASGDRSGGCPPHHRRRGHSTAAAAPAASADDDATTTDPPPSASSPSGGDDGVTLSRVPSMPVFGSFFVAVPFVGGRLREYFGVPMLTKNNSYEFQVEMYRKYGDFYSFGIPGMGTNDRHGTVYVLNDPKEMMKVLRQEGAHPRGGIQGLFPFVSWAKERGMSIASGDENGFFGRGEDWRRQRTFLQTDLLSPQAAKGYVPGVTRAAEIASRGAPGYASKGDLNTFLNYAAFDMFNNVLFGELTRVADPTTPTDPVNVEFCKESCGGLAATIEQLVNKGEGIRHRMGIKTDLYKESSRAFDVVRRIATDKMEAFAERWEAGELNEAERSSYLAHALERQKDPESAVSRDELVDLFMLMFNASVDTTSNFLCWAVVHLALNPDAQDRLHDEVRRNVEEGGDGGGLHPDHLSRARSPYLHAVLRESHRLTPVHPTTMSKSNSSGDIVVHGVDLPKDSVFVFDSYSVGMDPGIISDPEAFAPERWFPEAVEARKGSRAEVVDHPFYRDPFSQGARRCPGSRVAVNEAQAMLAQLVLDWKMELADEVKPSSASRGIRSFRDVKYEQRTLLLPEMPPMNFTARS